MSRATEIDIAIRPGESSAPPLHISGWLDKSRTYLWFGPKDSGPCYGTLDGVKLKNLARKVLKEMGP